MKIRHGFVTNSSSANYVVAYKNNFTPEQKIAIADYVIGKILGDLLLHSGTSIDESKKILEKNWYEEDEMQGMIDMLELGYDIYQNVISYEEADYTIRDLYKGIFNTIKKVAPDEFKIIYGEDLEY